MALFSCFSAESEPTRASAQQPTGPAQPSTLLLLLVSKASSDSGHSGYLVRAALTTRATQVGEETAGRGRSTALAFAAAATPPD